MLMLLILPSNGYTPKSMKYKIIPKAQTSILVEEV